MNKCLKITVAGIFPGSFFHDVLQKYAKKLKIEGTAQVLPDNVVRIIACGTKEAVDAFLDELHKSMPPKVPPHIEIEPFLKDKDYRGVFRIIE